MWTRVFYILSVVLGIAGFCAIPFLVGVHDLIRTMAQVGWGCVVLFVVNASGTLVFPAIGCWLLMRAEGIPVALGTVVQANLMGFPLDFVVPSAYLGGEPLKTVYIARCCQVPAPRVLAIIMVGKFQELGGLLLCMLAAMALFVQRTDYVTRPQALLILVVLVVVAGLLGAILYTFIARLQPLRRLLKVLTACGFFRRHTTRLRALAEEMEQRIYLALTARVRVLLLAQAVTCLSAVSLFLRPWIFLRALPGGSIGFDHLCALFILTNLVNVLTVVPGSLGWFEATMTGYANATGLGDAKGAAFALLSRLADLVLLTLGYWLIVHYGLMRVARGLPDAQAAEDHTPR